MGAIEEIYEDLDADLSLAEFREQVEAKVEQMGGLADEEAAAMLVAHELDEVGGKISDVASIEAGMEEVEFTAKVVGISDLRTFERDGEDEEGRVINVEVADESGSVRVSFWDQQAQNVADGEIEVGDVLAIKGRPKEGLNGVEVSVQNARIEEDVEIDVNIQDTYRVSDLSLGLSDVDLRGKLLDTDSVRTFDRDDGSEGQVSNLVVGDETGRIRVTLWDEKADLAEELDPGVSVEIVDGYVRERDGDLELHVGNRGTVDVIDEDIEYVPDNTDIEALEIGDTADIVGVVRSVDDLRTFDRDDGSEGQVRNIRVQDKTGDIRVALWGDKADTDLGPGDKVHLADVRIEEGWQDDIEAAANWRSTVTILDAADGTPGGGAGARDESEVGLDSFAGGGSAGGSNGRSDAGSSTGASDAGGFTGASDAGGSTDASDTGGSTDATDDGSDTGADSAGDAAAPGAPDLSTPSDGDPIEFTGAVVQAGDPVVLDNGEETMSVNTSEDVTLGEERTVRGTYRNGRVDADELI